MNAVASNTQVRRSARDLRALQPGDMLDAKYRLDGMLGAGAMGQVWLARNLLLDLPVAIKVLQPEPPDDKARERLLTEARYEAQLRHPNVVRVFDVRADAELSYVVMELLEGCTLADLMDEGPLPATLAVRLVLPLLEGLSAVHRAGIVHRDIKPENVFLARAGERVCPKLLDFGIAHNDSAGVEPGDERVVMGTPGYMSPEQAWGEERVDHRSDIWSLGVVLYEALRGEAAYPCTNYLGFLRELEEHEPAPIEGQADGELWAIVKRAMAKDVNQRFQTSSELAHALSCWLRERGVTEDLTGETLPQHWATPGSQIYRAWRDGQARTQDQRDKPSSYTRTRRADLREARTASSDLLQGPLPSSRMSAARTLRRKPIRASAWAIMAGLAGAVCGVTIALARTDDSLLLAPRVAARPVVTQAAPVIAAALPVLTTSPSPRAETRSLPTPAEPAPDTTDVTAKFTPEASKNSGKANKPVATPRRTSTKL
ncbi:MAG: serine/threonine-protein kinase, partial [Polyangiales bacterium]